MKNGIARGFFITGTDTGIGKTYVSRLCAEGFAHSHTVNYMKPVQTGCTRNASGELSAPDLDYLRASGVIADREIDDSVPYRFEPACSPHLAASLAGVTISIDYLRKKFNAMANRKSITIVEGAGGVLAPLSGTTTMADLMAHLRIPVIVVAATRIGTLNHTSLTIEALAGRNIDIAGVVLNNVHAMVENYIYHDIVCAVRDMVPSADFLALAHDAGCDERVREFCDALFKRF
jgi:dethiobiotin synthase